MAKIQRIPVILICLWVFSLCIFATYSINQRFKELSELHDQDATSLHQRVSQRADQHDAHLTSLSAVANASATPPIDLMLQVAENIQRFYPRIISVDLISLKSKKPIWILSTRKAGEVTQGLAETIQKSALASTGTLILKSLMGKDDEYLIIKRSPNSDAARYGLALGIRPSKLLETDKGELPQASIFLTLPNSKTVFAIRPPQQPTTIGWQPPALIFEQNLGSRSQPLLLRVEQRPTVKDLLPLGSILWFTIFLTVTLVATYVFVKQRTETHEAQTRAKLGEHEARIAQASRINSLGEMASGIAHELNQPLTAILSQSQAGVRLINGEVLNKETVLQVLEDNVQQSKRAGKILARLRNWTKNKVDSAETTNLNTVAADIAGLLRTDHRERGITLTLLLADEALLIKGDSVEIEQVIFNLVRNAADAIDETDKEIREIILETEKSQEFALIRITDSGNGIANEISPRLFEPFQTTKADGMGLGLALCESITQRLGGTIKLSNSPQGGASAVVSIPLFKEDLGKGTPK